MLSFDNFTCLKNEFWPYLPPLLPHILLESPPMSSPLRKHRALIRITCHWHVHGCPPSTWAWAAYQEPYPWIQLALPTAEAISYLPIASQLGLGPVSPVSVHVGKLTSLMLYRFYTGRGSHSDCGFEFRGLVSRSQFRSRAPLPLALPIFHPFQCSLHV